MTNWKKINYREGLIFLMYVLVFLPFKLRFARAAVDRAFPKVLDSSINMVFFPRFVMTL